MSMSISISISISIFIFISISISISIYCPTEHLALSLSIVQPNISLINMIKQKLEDID